MRRYRTPLLTVLSLFALAVTPAAAARGGTWWVAADGWWVQPSGPDFDTAFEYTSALNMGGQVIGPDLGEDLSMRLRFGWQPKRDGNFYFASYWSSSGSESLEKSIVIPIVSDPFFANVYSDRVETGATVKAQILDLMLGRRLYGTRKSTWIWTVGLRHAAYEQDWEIDYYEAGLPGFIGSGPEESVRMQVDSQGIGLTAGIGATYEWHKRWRTMARAQWSLLRGQTDASSLDRGYDTIVQVFFASGMEKNNVDRVFRQLDLEARVIFNVWRTLDVSLGYWFLDWTGAAEDMRFLDDVQGGASFARRDVAFDGFVLGVSYQFK